jgi:hypothetical protein
VRELLGIGAAVLLSVVITANEFDHGYETYGRLLSQHVEGPLVDYAALKADRATLDRIVASFDDSSARDEPRWTRDERMAFWINAYNVFTLRAIVDNYPIRSGWFTLQPRNSIRQIDDVWTARRWQAAGRTVSLDDIEHEILRPAFKDARIHFAVNCASIGCPPLAEEPYRAVSLDAQLDAAARRYLGSPQGLRIDGRTLRVSSIFKWYGDDFVDTFAPLAPPGGDAKTRAILGTIIRYGSAEAAALARTEGRIVYLEYDWSLNDLKR